MSIPGHENEILWDATASLNVPTHSDTFWAIDFMEGSSGDIEEILCIDEAISVVAITSAPPAPNLRGAVVVCNRCKVQGRGYAPSHRE